MILASARRMALAMLALTIILTATTTAQESRIWTDKSGKHEIRAKFIDLVDGTVRLERPNGDISRIPLTKLSKKDQEFVNNWEAPEKKTPPKPTGPRYLKVGDRVDAEHFGKWYPGVVIEIDFDAEHANVKLDNGKTAHFCDEEELRWPGTREAPIVKPEPDPALADLKVVEPDYSDMLRVAGDDSGKSTVTPDPLPSPPSSWRPRAVRLDAPASVHVRIADFSVAVESQPLALLLSTDPFAKSAPPKLELVDLTKRKKLIEGPAPPYTSRAVLSPSGNRIATLTTGKSSSNSLGRLNIWNLSGKEVSHVIAFSPYEGESWARIDPEVIAWVDDNHLLTTNSSGLTYLWNVEQAKAVYEVLTQGRTTPVLSPGRKQLAIPTEQGIDILDARTGSQLAKVGTGNLRFAHLAFSPSGRQIAAVSSGFVDVVDVTTGELTRSFPIENINGFQGLAWADETYLLVDNRALIHVPMRIRAWQFETNSQTSATAGGTPWLVVSSMQHNARTLTPLTLPPPGVVDAIAKIDQEEMLVVKPGAEVAIKADISDRALGQAVEEALKQAAADAGMQVTAGASLVLRATVKNGKTEKINYRSFHDHFGKGETIDVTQRVYEIQLLQDGTKLWQRESIHSPPMHLRMEEGESTQAAIRRVMEPKADHFRGRLPTYIVRPEFQGPLGTSRVTGG